MTANQIWAAKDSDLDLSGFNQGQGNGVLVGAQESLGPIDGIEGPKTAGRLAATAIYPGADLFRRGFGHQARGEMSDTLKGSALFRGAQSGRIFFANQGVSGEGAVEQISDQRL
jgi:hypothetical protein